MTRKVVQSLGYVPLATVGYERWFSLEPPSCRSSLRVQYLLHMLEGEHMVSCIKWIEGGKGKKREKKGGDELLLLGSRASSALISVLFVLVGALTVQPVCDRRGLGDLSVPPFSVLCAPDFLQHVGVSYEPSSVVYISEESC